MTEFPNSHLTPLITKNKLLTFYMPTLNHQFYIRNDGQFTALVEIGNLIIEGRKCENVDVAMKDCERKIVNFVNNLLLYEDCNLVDSPYKNNINIEKNNITIGKNNSRMEKRNIDVDENFNYENSIEDNINIGKNDYFQVSNVTKTNATREVLDNTPGNTNKKEEFNTNNKNILKEENSIENNCNKNYGFSLDDSNDCTLLNGKKTNQKSQSFNISLESYNKEILSNKEMLTNNEMIENNGMTNKILNESQIKNASTETTNQVIQNKKQNRRSIDKKNNSTNEKPETDQKKNRKPLDLITPKRKKSNDLENKQNNRRSLDTSLENLKIKRKHTPEEKEIHGHYFKIFKLMKIFSSFILEYSQNGNLITCILKINGKQFQGNGNTKRESADQAFLSFVSKPENCQENSETRIKNFCMKNGISFPEYVFEKEKEVYKCTALFNNKSYVSRYFFEKEDAKEYVVGLIFSDLKKRRENKKEIEGKKGLIE